MNILRMTGDQQARLKAHLFPGDGFEAVAVALCGRARGGGREVWTVHQIVEIAHAGCIRGSDFVTWPTASLRKLLPEAAAKNMAVLKIHSHPTNYRQFSDRDDRADEELFRAVQRRVPGPHVSAVMLPDGEIFARIIDGPLPMVPIDRVAVVGSDLLFFDHSSTRNERDFDQRHRQAFGDRTTDLLGGLTVGLVGISGTGSPTTEMLTRLGVGRIVQIEPDIVEAKNLNRIYGATRADVSAGRNKAEMMAAYIARIDLGTEVISFNGRVDNPRAIDLLAGCDVVFGCMDSVEGRDTLNRLATFYTLPYFDLGVRLDADGIGGVNSVSGSVHYLLPGASSLRSRGVYTDQQVYAEYLKRTDPAFYDDQVKRGYIHGVTVERPAVISINTAIASLAVNELLARLHPFRTVPNSEFAIHKILFSHGRTARRGEGPIDAELASWLGRGDCRPLLMCGRLESAA
ncbi:ThiF family adenylyltransferase [Caulobacter sp.]|uniref:ThiF family adenylyltransferase n=1 Tax=Caulobacter sp. TaxID=78 RepID=UPI003BB07746